MLAELGRGDQHQVLQHRHALHLSGNLEGTHEAQPKGAVHLHPVNAPAAEDNPAAGRRQRPGHQIEERRLARAVGADQSRDGARHDLQGAVVHGPDPAEVLDHVAHLQHGRRLRHVASLAVSRHRL